MSISKKGTKGKGNDAVASRLADFTGEKEVPIAGHSKMSSLEQEDANSGPESDPSVNDLTNSMESTSLIISRDPGKVLSFLIIIEQRIFLFYFNKHFVI